MSRRAMNDRIDESVAAAKVRSLTLELETVARFLEARPKSDARITQQAGKIITSEEPVTLR